MFLCTGMIRIVLEYLREHIHEYYVITGGVIPEEVVKEKGKNYF